MKTFKGVTIEAKLLTIFICPYHKTLAIMRKYTTSRDIVRSDITRFANSFNVAKPGRKERQLEANVLV